ncbi:c-type cytochrome [Rugamonas sp. CCM 8940]|uniref:c-type cytochrome n=1 Tax=Rugamonas sp. CCM 8940 TaxID=2765359 RepID=UPI0018F776C4|nr:cytochrome c [Rugamonas sp. CCM 8940]MBJ7308979.1 cytochrome c [Rugamonas sp. CCM 8940]
MSLNNRGQDQRREQGQEPAKPRAARRENADPVEQANPVPKVVMGLVLGLVVWAVGYIFVQEAGGDVSLGDRRDPSTLTAAVGGTADGAQIFASRCAACHQANGKGLPGVFPPLAGSPWVTGDADTALQIVLHGMTGPIEVLGTTYNGAMPAFAEQLSDAELAAVLTHARATWGNAAAPIDAAAAAAARAVTAARGEPWNGAQEIATVLAAAPK